MARNNNTDWKRIVDITYEVTEKQLARGRQFQHTLAKTLDVGGEYNVRRFSTFMISNFKKSK